MRSTIVSGNRTIVERPGGLARGFEELRHGAVQEATIAAEVVARQNRDRAATAQGPLRQAPGQQTDDGAGRARVDVGRDTRVVRVERPVRRQVVTLFRDRQRDGCNLRIGDRIDHETGGLGGHQHPVMDRDAFHAQNLWRHDAKVIGPALGFHRVAQRGVSHGDSGDPPFLRGTDVGGMGVPRLMRAVEIAQPQDEPALARSAPRSGGRRPAPDRRRARGPAVRPRPGAGHRART